jgi:sucrose phosphorylase
VDLNFRNPRVLLAVLEVLLFYVRKGARFIRLDAIAYLWKEIGTPCIHLPQTHRIVQLFRAVLEAVAPAVLLVTETNVPHAENLSYFGDGTNEAQLVYNFALPPLVLHALQTGNATALNRWAAALRLPSERVSCLNFLASHDGIGLNPARGLLRAAEIQALVAGTLAHGGLVSYKDNPDGTQSPYELNTTYFDALSDPRAAEPLDTQIDRFMVAHAIMLAFIGVPGIYLPSLVGARNDRAGAEASGMARRINRRKFSRSELETQLADPASMAARVLARFRELLGARRSHAAFHPQGQQQVLDCGPHVVALWRTSPTREEQVLCLHNVAAHPVEVGISDRPVPPGAQWVDVLHEGGGTALGDRGLRLVVPAYGIRWMKLVSRSR